MASRLRLLAVTGIFAGACAGAVVLLPDITYSSWLDRHGACSDGYRDGPYGNVTKCHPLDSEVPFFGGPDARAWVLLETERGLVGLRVDYRNTDAGRQYTAVGFELSPQDTPNLSADQARKLEADVDARGGVRGEEWWLHYGDG